MTTPGTSTLRIGAGAGYSGDRIEPALELAEKGRLHYLVFECLAERTIALAQLARQKNPDLGYDPLLEARFRTVLPACVRNGVKVITNMGAAHPVAALEKTAEVARELGLKGLKIAAVTGDDVLPLLRTGSFTLLETGEALDNIRDRMVSANAYLGMDPILQALEAGADVVITGRVSDPALFMAPLFHEFGWRRDDPDLLGKATVLGHLLECAGQVTGGYFADPGIKDVPGIERLGFPLAEVWPDGRFELTKVEGSGGRVTPATCKEQLLYEIHDPASYLTPDVTADFSRVRFTPLGTDRVGVEGATGRPRSGLLKVSVGYRDSWIGEGQISYGGPGAEARGRLALDIVRARLEDRGFGACESRYELLGVDSLYGPMGEANPGRTRGEDAREVRVRVAVRTTSPEEARLIGEEVETLYTNGPAGGGGATKTVRKVLAVQSVLLDASLVQHHVTLKTS
ncbi:MAG: acyclic terpene utilization AtuA family protein [Bacteroidales bacterium]